MSLPVLLAAMLAIGKSDADTTFRLPRGSAIEIDTQNQDVTLHIGQNDVATIRGASANLGGHTLQVGESHRRNGNSGMIDITVPSWVRVEISTVTGSIILDGSPAKLHAETVDGTVRLTGGSGEVEIESVAGQVDVTNFHGTSLSIDATNEAVNITGATGKIHVESVNGAVKMHGIRSSDVSVSTINDRIEFEGRLATDGTYDFESHNDDVTLLLPADVSARMRILTANGEFSTEIPATTGGRDVTPPPARGKPGKQKGRDPTEHEVTVVYGKGDARVNIDAYNGDVKVKRSKVS